VVEPTFGCSASYAVAGRDASRNHAARYYTAMIVSFRDPDTATLAGGRRVSRFVRFETVARRTLRQLEIAGRLEDLRAPPGNRLKALKRERLG